MIYHGRDQCSERASVLRHCSRSDRKRMQQCSLQELRQLLRKVITKKPQGNQLTEVWKQFSITRWTDSQEPRV